ncbi:DUF58 domain-containing protein [Planctomicrobium sp. SH664]|uniref:DUF58 domain-containing protein n=1 Tax=Planctomicrobium sp. SH664 TaxID=3448125 RepID=UPI003F5BC338
MRLKATLSRVSLQGIIAFLLGIGFIVFELKTNIFQRRMGVAGHWVILFSFVGIALWGLKEMISSMLPGAAHRSMRFSIPKEGLFYLGIMVVLFVGSLMGRNNPLLLVFTLLAGPFVMNGWYTFTLLRRLRVKRQLPDRVMAGETFVCSVVLENRKWWLSVWMMTVHDRVTSWRGSLETKVLFMRVPAGRETTGHYHLQLLERGRYEFGPVHITTRFPLGLVERGVRLNDRQQLLVHPRLGRLNPEWRRQLQHSAELVNHLRPVAGIFQDEMHRIREYRPGDDPRMIHWKTSARMNELMVCDYQESRDRDLILIVDAWTSEAQTEADRDKLERALRFAATVCMSYLHNARQSSLNVRLFGKEVVDWRGNCGDQHADVLLDELALLESSQHQVFPLINGLDTDYSRQRRVIIISTRPHVVSSAIARWTNGNTMDVQVYGSTSEDLSSVFYDLPHTAITAQVTES